MCELNFGGKNKGTEAVSLVFGSQNSNSLCQKGSSKQHTFVLREPAGWWRLFRDPGKPCNSFTRDIMLVTILFGNLIEDTFRTSERE